MDYILDKYVSPRVLMMLDFSSSRRRRRDGGWGNFSEGVSLEEASVSICWIGQSIEEEGLCGRVCPSNDVHRDRGFLVLQVSVEMVCAVWEMDIQYVLVR